MQMNKHLQTILQRLFDTLTENYTHISRQGIVKIEEKQSCYFP